MNKSDNSSNPAKEVPAIGSDAPPPAVVPAKQRWASDVIVDLLHAYDLPHAALNPGASYRGLHDSIVNYGQNRPTMMLCQHEETAVQVAHGYAKAIGQADGRDPAQPRGPAARATWRSTTPTSTARRSSSSAPPARWTRPSAARASTGSIPRRGRARRCGSTRSGTTSRTPSTACRNPSPAPTA